MGQMHHSTPAMPRSSSVATACGKVILCGEHAVVYGEPAIAIPVSSRRVYVTVEPGEPGTGLVFAAHDLGARWHANSGVTDPRLTPIEFIVGRTLAYLRQEPADLVLTITSDLPPASGLGSSAAVAVALIRAIAGWFEATIPPADLSALTYESEQLQHGTPSGIDNTVVAYEQPIWFWTAPVGGVQWNTPGGVQWNTPGGVQWNTPGGVQWNTPGGVQWNTPGGVQWNTPGGVQWNTPTGATHTPASARSAGPQFEPLHLGAPLHLLIADTGISSITREVVGAVRAAWQADPVTYNTHFAAIGRLVRRAREEIAAGDPVALGPLLDQNHALLQAIGVSCPELDHLVTAARRAGALGAKLSGAGRGGNLLALVTPETSALVADALRAAGARQVIATTIT